jgi:hypothetical protein
MIFLNRGNLSLYRPAGLGPKNFGKIIGDVHEIITFPIVKLIC